MIRRVLPLLLAAFALAAAAPAGRAASCDSTSKGFVALTDLGPGTYQGVQGGLYPGGVNGRPAAHEAAGVAIASAIVPLDTLGQPDAVNGRIVFVSIGMSNATQEFSAFVPKSNADPLRRPQVRAIDCAVGGQSADVIANPAAAYWDSVATRLRGRGSSPLQAQVAWVKEADRQPTGAFGPSRDTLAAHLRRIAWNIRAKLPSVRIVYFTSRIYAGYANTALNPEPYAYESGFAVKQVIAGQIAGDADLHFDPNAGPVAAPWLSWGPYLWADGLAGRADGMTWACSQFATDGTHPSVTGRNVVADSLLRFLHEDASATWYRQGPLGVSPPGGGAVARFTAGPSPAATAVRLEWSGAGRPARYSVFDLTGRVRRSLAPDAAGRATWDLHDDAGERVRPGVYWVRAGGEGGTLVRAVIVR